MHRLTTRCVPLAFLVAGAASSATAGEPAPLTLADVAAGRARIVDLAYALDEKSNFWPGDDYKPFALHTIATLEKDGVLSKAMSFPEHIGTHIDAPNHFEPDRPDVSRIPPEQFFAPGVVIDVTMQAEQNPDYGLTAADVLAWEKEHGRIPEHAVVLLKTGWGRFWANPVRFRNADARGTLHFPSYLEESARLLVEKRNVRGIGIDNLSIDRGISKDFAVHHVVNKARRYGLENVAHLDELPPRGFWLFIAPIKVAHGTGGPTRVFAILPPKAE